MDKQLLKDLLGWGFILWLIGYILGIALFFVLPPSILGWVITPIGTMITIWVLTKKVKSEALGHYLLMAVVWTAIAIAFDYFFILKAFNPADGYYKLDVYLYYTLTFVLPLIIGLMKQQKTNK